MLATLGLAAIAEYFYEGLPACFRTLQEGFAMAWDAEYGGPSGAMDPTGGGHSLTEARLEHAARTLARGQQQLVALLLMAIATYLLRGSMKASIEKPLDSVASRSAELGKQLTNQQFAKWLERHQGRLLERVQARPATLLAEQGPGVSGRLVEKPAISSATAPAANQLFESIYAKAGAAKVQIDRIADQLAEKYNGMVAKAPIKSAQRALEKINSDYGGDARRIKDLARNTIIVDDSKISAVVDDLRALGAKVKVIDGASDTMGYSGVNSSLMTRAGIAGEIQVNSPAMIYAKEPEVIARTLLGNDAYDVIAAKTALPGGSDTVYTSSGAFWTLTVPPPWTSPNAAGLITTQ